MFDWSFHHQTEGSGHLEAKTFGFCPLVPEFRCSTEMTFLFCLHVSFSIVTWVGKSC